MIAQNTNSGELKGVPLRDSYRPSGRLGSAGLLEGDVEIVGAGIVGVGGDGG